MRVSVDWYRAAYKRRWGKDPPECEINRITKPSKLRNIKVEVGDIIFASKWEAAVHADLMFQYKAGLITEPLIQVRFSLGVWHSLGVDKPSERFYVADFVYIVLKTGEFVIADAKGHLTEKYKAKRKLMRELYGICITEFFRERRRKKNGYRN